MTALPLAPLATSSAVGSDDSVVAVTLSWPWRHGGNPGGSSVAGSHIIEMIGDIDISIVERVRSLLTAVAAQNSELLVDVSAVRFIDASGLGLLAMLHEQLSASGGEMRLIGVPPRVGYLLGIAGLEHLLHG
jgi:anti-anti-sigma factor